jgi:hypothetical protein
MRRKRLSTQRQPPTPRGAATSAQDSGLGHGAGLAVCACARACVLRGCLWWVCGRQRGSVSQLYLAECVVRSPAAVLREVWAAATQCTRPYSTVLDGKGLICTHSSVRGVNGAVKVWTGFPTNAKGNPRRFELQQQEQASRVALRIRHQSGVLPARKSRRRCGPVAVRTSASPGTDVANLRCPPVA